jgi:hypothetical protein
MHRTYPAAPTVAAAALPVAWSFGGALAQDLEPRLYTNVPVGMNFLGAGYAYSDGNVLFDPAVALENAQIELDGPALGYGRSIGFGPFSGKVDGAIAQVCLELRRQGERVTRNVCGSRTRARDGELLGALSAAGLCRLSAGLGVGAASPAFPSATTIPRGS